MKALKFYSSNCELFNQLNEIIHDNQMDLFFENIDVNDFPSLAKAYRIKTVPTIIILDNDHQTEVIRQSGLLSASELKSLIREG